MAAKKRPAPPKRYHHGDLRRALMDAALGFLEGHDVTRLTMQELSRLAGVSRGAPYHHFADKEAVIEALATEGFDLLLARGAHLDWDVPPVQALAQAADAYLDFTAAHPVHHRLMFLPEWSDRDRYPGLHAAAEPALGLLVGAVLGQVDRTPRAAVARALNVFALLHGFAQLRAIGLLDNAPGAPSARAQRADLLRCLQAMVARED